MKKEMAKTSPTFRVRVMLTPMASPMGDMAMSTPSENRPMPKINNTAPPINNAMMFKGRGAREKLKARTINVMGTTEAKAS